MLCVSARTKERALRHPPTGGGPVVPLNPFETQFIDEHGQLPNISGVDGAVEMPTGTYIYKHTPFAWAQAIGNIIFQFWRIRNIHRVLI